VHARKRLSLFQKPARGSVLLRYHIFARISQTDRRSNESVITDVARNNENLLVGTVFNSDAIRLGVSTRTITRARTCMLGNGILPHDRTNEIYLWKDVRDRMKAAARNTLSRSVSYQSDLRKIK